MSIETLLLAIIAFAAGSISVFSLWHYFYQIERRLTVLEEAEKKRQQILVDARGRERAHHAYNTLAAIEDATALLIDAELDLDAIRARQETALSILKVLRKGPNQYKKSQPTERS
jgi:hypothetical protein